jgi:hypothetical protein
MERGAMGLFLLGEVGVVNSKLPPPQSAGIYSRLAMEKVWDTCGCIAA